MNEIIGISWEGTNDHKIASLFCEKIVGIGNSDVIPKEIRYNIDIKKLPRFRLLNIQFQEMAKIAREMHKNGSLKDKETTVRLAREFVEGFDNSSAVIIQEELFNKRVRTLPFFEPKKAYKPFFTNYNSSDAIQVDFKNIPVIDVDRLDWKHIVEVRKDEDFNKKLRKFRLLIQEEYKGKDANYVADSIQDKIYEYEEACKKHGISLILSSVRQILNSKSLLGTMGLITAGILTGNPLVITASAITGTLIEVGKLGIEISEKKIAHNESISNEGIAYLVDLKKSMKKKSSR